MEILDIIKSRRSISPEFFKSKKIEKNKLDIILESSNWAPTHKKTEPWRFKIVKGRSKFYSVNFCQKNMNCLPITFQKLNLIRLLISAKNLQ